MHTFNPDISSNHILSFFRYNPSHAMTETHERVETKKTFCRWMRDERHRFNICKVSCESDMLPYYVNKQRTKYKHLKHRTRRVWRNLSVWTEGRIREPEAA
jgi:hypothetical protein